MPAIDEMLMMTPLACRRMIGITCLAARMQLLRLIATQRSNASSVIASSSASPPARLTPTLLCRISMRPQRSWASWNHRLYLGIFGHVGLEGDRGALLACDHVDGFLRRCKMMIDAQHLGALAGERERRGAAVADAFAGTLPGPNDDGDAIFQAHVISLRVSGTAQVPLYNKAHCRSSSSPAPAPPRSRRRW